MYFFFITLPDHIVLFGFFLEVIGVGVKKQFLICTYL